MQESKKKQKQENEKVNNTVKKHTNFVKRHQIEAREVDETPTPSQTSEQTGSV